MAPAACRLKVAVPNTQFLSMLGLDFGSFVLVYLACTVLVVFVLLFGENLVFEGTPVAWLHWLITQGVWDGGR